MKTLYLKHSGEPLRDLRIWKVTARKVTYFAKGSSFVSCHYAPSLRRCWKRDGYVNLSLKEAKKQLKAWGHRV